MACVNPDGTLTSSAQELLKLATEPRSPEQISAALGSPLYKVRASLREMLAAGLVMEKQGGYQATEKGLGRVDDVVV
jgi:predicted transcriptional regulator